MGHLVGKDVYRALGQKLDNLTCKTPYTPEFEAILRKLYSAAEAELIVKMPYGLSSARRISRIVGYDVTDQLAELADRGLLMDVLLEDGPAYIVSPFVIGVFEFTMMRTRGQVEPDAWARLFSAYLDSGVLYGANAHEHIAVPPMRTLPHEASLNPGVCEVLDFDRASAMIARNTVFAMGACSCRHEKLHLGEKTCDIPLETCASMGGAAEY
ncbi:4Fe-4S ferredoxin, partial [Myxococcota bacterium]|nr:4Fe-4S ferredoxin [Myxococcota bacterium]